MNDISGYVEQYRTFDEPVPYNGLYIYPVKVVDYYKFMSSIDILKIDKNKIPDIRVIQMSYLTFLLGIIVESTWHRDKFINVLELCFHVQKDDKCLNEKFPFKEILLGHIDNKEVYFINGYDVNVELDGNFSTLNIGDVKIAGQDFNDVIDIIYFLNIAGYDNEEMSDDFKALLEEYYRLKNKNIKPPTLEEQLIAIMAQNGMTKRDLMNETIYTVKGMVDVIVGVVDYQIQHNYRAHAMTDNKLPDIEHWLIKSNKGKYDDVFSDLDSFKKNFEA